MNVVALLGQTYINYKSIPYLILYQEQVSYPISRCNQSKLDIVFLQPSLEESSFNPWQANRPSTYVFQKVTWLIKNVMWLKVYVYGLFTCHVVGVEGGFLQTKLEVNYFHQNLDARFTLSTTKYKQRSHVGIISVLFYLLHRHPFQLQIWAIYIFYHKS